MITLQNVIFPDKEICTEIDLYFHTRGDAGFSSRNSCIWLSANSSVYFDSYFNALSIGKWDAECEIDNLYLSVEGEGECELLVFFAKSEKSWERLYSDRIELSANKPHIADLSHFDLYGSEGLIFFELKGLSNGVFTGAKFFTDTTPKTKPKLAVSITTFMREQEVENTVARLSETISSNDYENDINVFVVDNGKSAEIENSDVVSYIPNANLGGAGGFARGLREAEAGGFTHCLFMDDDASFHMENILRTYAFLALAKSPKTAIAGAMISNTHKWCMWENGAYFDKTCHPLFCGLDLKHRDNILRMESTPPRHDDPNFYGGWWFFAFPIAEVKTYPFPFFVRGDDINFSLTNDFRINTLNGIVSFQDDFTDKESAQTLYLDLRNHLVQHLTVESLEISSTKCAGIAVWFLARALSRFHYETAEALLLSWNDVLSGPEFFASNVDMAKRRGDIKAMMHNELWGPVDRSNLEEKIRFSATHGLKRKFFRASLNGHLLPFFGQWGNHRVIQSLKRSTFGDIWGSSKLTYLNAAKDKSYTVKQSKFRFLLLTLRIAATYVKFVMKYSKLRDLYRKEHPKLASKSFWENQDSTNN